MLPDSLLHGDIYMFSNHKAGSPPDPFHMLRAAIMTSEAKITSGVKWMTSLVSLDAYA